MNLSLSSSLIDFPEFTCVLVSSHSIEWFTVAHMMCYTSSHPHLAPVKCEFGKHPMANPAEQPGLG